MKTIWRYIKTKLGNDFSTFECTITAPRDVIQEIDDTVSEILDNAQKEAEEGGAI